MKYSSLNYYYYHKVHKGNSTWDIRAIKKLPVTVKLVFKMTILPHINPMKIDANQRIILKVKKRENTAVKNCLQITFLRFNVSRCEFYDHRVWKDFK